MRARRRIERAVRNCAPFALTIFLTYVVSSAVGILMAHGGSPFALEHRDRIVGKALATDAASIAYRSGEPVRALVHDFAGNLLCAAVPQAVGGLAVVPPYFSVAWQGWVGGIVSVDGGHRSRLRSVEATSYYFLVLFLQFVPFSLAIGSGVRCGLELYRHNLDVGWRFWRYRLATESLVDVACVFALATPLFLAASAFEFLSPWNR